MDIFRNFIVVIILAGVVTRISKYILSKYLDDKIAVIYISSISSGVIICTVASFTVGFDVVVAEYIIAFIVWFVFDLMRAGAKA